MVSGIFFASGVSIENTVFNESCEKIFVVKTAELNSMIKYLYTTFLPVEVFLQDVAMN